MKKVLSVLLSMLLLMSIIPAGMSASAASEDVWNSILRVDIVQNKLLLPDGCAMEGEEILLYFNNVEAFNYKITYKNNSSEILTYSQLANNKGMSIYKVQYLGGYQTYGDEIFMKAGNQSVKIIFSDNYFATTTVYVSPFLSWLSGKSATTDFGKMLIQYEDDGKYTYYWKIKPKATNNYALYSNDWNQISPTIIVFDSKNDMVDYTDSVNLKAGKEYVLAIVYTYNVGCSKNVEFWLEPNREHVHSYSLKTVVKATPTKNGRADKICSSCGNVSFSKKINSVKTIKLSSTGYTYDGKTKKPSVIVKDAAGNKLKNKVDYTIKYPKSAKSIGSYKVVVEFKGNYSGSKTLTFKITPPKTSIKSLTAGKKSLKVSIAKKSSQVTGYEIQYSTSKKFSGAKIKTIKSYKTTSATIKSLKAKKTYYVRVRTYKTVSGKEYCSAWSSYKYKKTK